MSGEHIERAARRKEAEGRRIDWLFAEAEAVAAEGNDYDAEVIAETAGILAERGGHTIDPRGPGARYVEPTRRARAAGRYVPTRAEIPDEVEYRAAVCRVLAKYARQDGSPREARALDADADTYESESIWAEAGGYELGDWPEGE